MKNRIWIAIKSSFITTGPEAEGGQRSNCMEGVRHGVDDHWSGLVEGISTSCGESAYITDWVNSVDKSMML